MFGKNKVMKQDLSSPGVLRVKEIFATMQGEGHRAGQRAVFIRLGGCNLRCAFCDTDFESDLQNLAVYAILDRVSALLPPPSLIVITGGEPMLQDISLLCSNLLDLGYVVQVETAGTVWVPNLPDAVEIVCSPKTKKVNKTLAEHVTSWKYIVKAGELDEFGLPKGTYWHPAHAVPSTIYLQPMDEQNDAKNEQNLHAAIESCMRYGHRLSLQQHKIIGLP